MKRVNILLVICALSQLPITFCHGENNTMTLWYEQPAKEWVQALPVGNGRLGAMVFGGTELERIQFNEDTLWTGIPRDYINPKALKTLPEVRQLLFEGKQKEAHKAAEDMMSVPLRQEAYQPFGDVHLRFPGHNRATEYRRELDLDEAVARVSYRVGDVTYLREVFSSAVDQVIVIRITADKPNQVSFAVSLDSPHSGVATKNRKAGSGALLTFTGQLGTRTNPKTREQRASILGFEARLKLEADGGELNVGGEEVTVTDADAVVLKLCGATSYESFNDVSADPGERCGVVMEAIAVKGYAELHRDHIADHQALFRRVSIDLGSSEAAKQPTDRRIKQFSVQEDPQLIALYLQYGRYLLIASSRPGSQPANLQGIWNQELQPPWDSKWTTNINAEMNYWPAEMGNLSECHEPLFDMLDDLVVTGGKIAREHYACRGWVLHHNTDIWRGAAAINASNHGIWMTGGAWLCQHLWLRYEYTRDEEFLAERAYPVLKKAALFFVDFLVEDPKTGWLISTPSNSPENGGLVAGPAMDHQIIRNLFSNCIKASEILGVDEELRVQLSDMRERIAPNQIGRHGQLQEWLEDKDDPENKHRHVSHLWGLHPGREITPLGTPELAEACKVTLSHRGDGGTGWSKAWKVNFWARLHDGNHAYKMLTELLSNSTLPNMFDTHPPFQIDGNFGGTSGITEMILQSHTGEIHLLPALPDALPQGAVRGLRARGAVEVDLVWKEGELDRANLKSLCGGRIGVRYRDRMVELDTQAGHRYVLDEGLNMLDDKRF